MDLTDDQDDIDPPLAGVTLADDALDASTRPIGRYYYFLVFFSSPYHSVLIPHVVHSRFLFSINMVLRTRSCPRCLPVLTKIDGNVEGTSEGEC